MWILILIGLIISTSFFSIQEIYAQPTEPTGEDFAKLEQYREYDEQQKLIRSILEPSIPIIVIGIIALVVIKVVLPRTKLSKRK